MTNRATSPLCGAIVSVPITPRRVFVRSPKSRVTDIALGLLGTATHQDILGGMALGMTVRLDNGTILRALPDWVTPARDVAALFGVAPL
jgi:hypothetical protein